MVKYFSILGDSISSYGGYSDDATVNTSLAINVASGLYRGDAPVIKPEDTWWIKAVRETGMKLLVNNTWGGARVFGDLEEDIRYNTYKWRCDNLHSDTGELKGTNPDVIAVYIGINDVRNNYGTIGSFEAVDFDALIKEKNGFYDYATPKTFAEAYVIMIHKIIKKYPHADVYCFNLLPEPITNERSTKKQVEFANSIIFKIADKYALKKVDLYNETGINISNADTYTYDGLHPLENGMDLIAKVFVNAIKENTI